MRSVGLLVSRLGLREQEIASSTLAGHARQQRVEERLEADLVEHEAVLVHRVGPRRGQPRRVVRLHLVEQHLARLGRQHREGVHALRRLDEHARQRAEHLALVRRRQRLPQRRLQPLVAPAAKERGVAPLRRVQRDALRARLLHLGERVELLLAPLARVQRRLQDVVEQVEHRPQRVPAVGGEVVDHLVEDGRQPVVVVKKEVVHDLHEMHRRRRARVRRADEQPQPQPVGRVVRRGRRLADRRAHHPRRALGRRHRRLAVVAHAHARRAAKADRVHVRRQPLLQAPHLPLRVRLGVRDVPAAVVVAVAVFAGRREERDGRRQVDRHRETAVVNRRECEDVEARSSPRHLFWVAGRTRYGRRSVCNGASDS